MSATVIDPVTARRARQRMVRELAVEGLQPAHRAAFERVPRHLFVPRFRIPRDGTDDGWELVDGTDPKQHQRWIDTAYSDEALFIQWDETSGLRCSSSSMPSVMAEMLVAADIRPGHRILEIGTGSGYNAALLCELAADVVSIDCDAELVQHARSRLSIAGYAPTVVAGDGFDGYAPDAPYDRVIATCAVRQVPRAWIAQTRPGGLVLAMLPHGMARLRINDDGTAAHGQFHSFPFAFMRMQGHWRTRRPEAELRDLVLQDGQTAPVGDLSIAEETERSPYFLLEQLVLFGCEEEVTLEGAQHGLVDLWDLSWARFNYDASTVTQGGPRRLWDEEQALFAAWRGWGRPGRERFGLSVPADGGCQEVWLDEPRSPSRWPLAGWKPEVIPPTRPIGAAAGPAQVGRDRLGGL